MLDRRIPLTIAALFLLQAGTAIWWAASKDTEDRMQAERVDDLAATMNEAADRQTQSLDRLARIEERLKAEDETLGRIEKRLGE